MSDDDNFEPSSPVPGSEEPRDSEIDSDDEYYNISQDILQDDLDPSRPPSPTPSLHDEPDEPMEDDEDSTPLSPFVLRTRRLRAVLDDLPDQEIEAKLSSVLDVLDENGLDVALFLEALCWGRECAVHNPRIRYARTSFMCSDELPIILKLCLKPPRWNSSTRKKRTKGGRVALASVVVQTCLDTMHEEMRELGPILSTRTATDVQASSLTGFSFPDLHKAMLLRAPTLVTIMNGIHERHPSPIITVTAICQLMYRHNRNFNLLQKTFAVYFKFKGLSAKGFDVLHALGLTMSHSWISDAVRRMSKMTLNELADLVTKHPWILTYDNVVILFKVFSQRLHNLQQLNSGTAATVYINPKTKPLPPSANADLKAYRAKNLDNPITGAELWELMSDSDKKLRPFYIRTILDFLLSSPEFDLEKYPFRDHQLLEPLERLNGLPTGKDAKWIQRLLGSVNQPEASYSDHEQLITEWLKQLKLMDPATTKDIGLNKIWRTTASDSGHTIEDLSSLTPLQLHAMAEKAYREHASSAALNSMRREKASEHDERQQLHTQFARDILPYLTLTVRAIKSGDVGLLEALLPTFLARFVGGGNTNYAYETLELISGLKRDWPPAVADFVRQNCWVLTFTGRPESFLSFDQAQEHNIKDVKVCAGKGRLSGCVGADALAVGASKACAASTAAAAAVFCFFRTAFFCVWKHERSSRRWPSARTDGSRPARPKYCLSTSSVSGAPNRIACEMSEMSGP
ncbi:hypothetical protein R3P38DRAFT_2533610 [Favolaschia claudopus]|uniref:DUF6589 domain-containing protein n=1 Tax=Favolaschia claudopus TaxID=2862362 RepID=A0AAW0B999_9AGAR